jgi:hypothetical protein
MRFDVLVLHSLTACLVIFAQDRNYVLEELLNHNAHSRREFMFIEHISKDVSNPEGIVCKCHVLHIIPSGLRKNCRLFFYKHIFPSGM